MGLTWKEVEASAQDRQCVTLCIGDAGETRSKSRSRSKSIDKASLKKISFLVINVKHSHLFTFYRDVELIYYIYGRRETCLTLRHVSMNSSSDITPSLLRSFFYNRVC